MPLSVHEHDDFRGLRRAEGSWGQRRETRKAAEAVASYENRFARIESDLAVVKRMIGFNLAITVVVLWKVFSA